MGSELIGVENLRATIHIMEVALGAIADAVLWTDVRGTVQWCNQACDRLFNCPHAAIVGSSLRDTLPLTQAGYPVEPSAYPDMRIRTGEQGVLTYNVELNGVRLTLDITGQWVDQGTDAVVVLVIQDVTQTRQAEQEREESLSMLRATLESTADGILVVNRDRNVLVYNQKFLQLWNIPGALMLPDRAEERLRFLADQTIDPDRFIAHIQDLFLDHPEAEVFDIVECKNGRVFERYSHPQWIGDAIVGRVWGFRDISKRRQVEEHLRQQQEMLRTVIDTDPSQIFVKDWEGRYVLVNKASAQFYNRTVDEVLGKRDADFNPVAADVERFLQENRQVIETGQEVFIPEEKATIGANRDQWFQWQKRPLRLPGSDTYSVLGIGVNITERKLAEIALRESEQRYASLAAAAPVGIFRTDAEGNCLYVNDRWCTIAGLTREEAQGFIVIQGVHPDDQHRVLATWNQATQTAMPFWLEYRFQHPDGTIICVFAQVVAERSIDHTLTGYVGTITDISDRKQLEEELLQSQRFLDSIIDNIPLALFAKDINNNFRYVLINKHAEKILGFDRERAIALNDCDLLSEEQAMFYRHEDQLVLAQAKPMEFERWINATANKQILVRGWKLPISDHQGNITHLLGIFEDITERRYREQALRLIVEGTAAKTGDEFFQSCVRYLAEVLQVQYALVTTCVDETKTRVRTLAIYGGGVFGENIEYDLHGTPCERVIQGEMCYYAMELQRAFPGDRPAIEAGLESYLGTPLTDVSGAILGHLAVMDVKPMETDPGRELILRIFAARAGAELERKQAEDALRIAKEAAEAANRAKSTFLANMSHELRTPLNAILGFAQLMERDATLPPRQRQSLAIINRSGEHLLDLINDVLEMSKIEAGRTTLHPAPFDLHGLLHTLQDLFQGRADAKHLSLQFNIAPTLPQYVVTDEGKLRQVLINLLSNAVKFTQQGYVILRAIDLDEVVAPSTVSIAPTRWLDFEVEDTGRGIAAQEIESLFQPFVQTTSGTQAREGTGLGLTISRQFVQLMGGDISLTSVVGQGSTFRFNVPVTLADPTEVSPPAYRGRVVGIVPDQVIYRILVVDDRAENRDLITQLLNTVGFETRTANHGQEAIAQWQEWRPHLIWMDMRMPVMDGYEATRQIRALEWEERDRTGIHGTETCQTNFQTKIIALTASAFEEQRANILAAGCNDFVRKPFKEQIIFEKMAEHLGVQYFYMDPDLDKGEGESGGGEIHRSPNPNSQALTSADLTVMSDRWVTALHQAALAADADQLQQLIDQIPEIHQSLADALTDLNHRSCFDALLELT